jgi:hypothetical protein
VDLLFLRIKAGNHRQKNKAIEIILADLAVITPLRKVAEIIHILIKD